MKLTITMELDNAAFEESRTDEIERILIDLVSRLPEAGDTNGDYSLHDLNGNWVGSARIDE